MWHDEVLTTEGWKNTLMEDRFAGNEIDASCGKEVLIWKFVSRREMETDIWAHQSDMCAYLPTHLVLFVKL